MYLFSNCICSYLPVLKFDEVVLFLTLTI